MRRPARAIAAAVPALSSIRRLGLLALVMAFALQAYFVQTHIHPQLTAPAVKVLLSHGGDGGAPVDPLDPNTCKLCREIVTATATLAPPAPSLLLVLDWVAASIPVSRLLGPAIPPESGWQSRAPPTH